MYSNFLVMKELTNNKCNELKHIYLSCVNYNRSRNKTLEECNAHLKEYLKCLSYNNPPTIIDYSEIK